MMNKRFLSILLVIALCVGMMPSALAEEDAVFTAAPAGITAEDAGEAAHLLDVRHYSAGEEETGDEAEDGPVFHPYEFKIGDDFNVTASVRMEPGLMKSGSTAQGAQASDGDDGFKINHRVVYEDPPVTETVGPPENLAGTITGEDFILNYNSGFPDAARVEVYAYTVNASLQMEGNPTILIDNLTTGYLRGIKTCEFGDSGVYRTTIGNITHVSVSGPLYSGSGPDILPGEKLFFVVEEENNDATIKSGPSNIVKLTVLSEDKLTDDELKTLMAKDVKVEQLSFNATQVSLSVSWTGNEAVDSYSLATFLMVNSTPVKMLTGSAPHKIELAGPGVSAGAAYQNNNGSCTYGPFMLDILPVGAKQYKEEDGNIYGGMYVKDGDIIVVRLEGNVGQTSQYTPPANDTIIIDIGSDEPVAIDLSATNTTVIKLTPESATYTGEQIKPEVEVTVGETTLRPGQDYTIEYGENKNVGRGKGSVTVIGMTPYTGNVTKTFDINPLILNINNTVIKLTPDNANYTGEKIEPTVEVTVNQNTLTKDQDYTVVYGENKNAGSDAGSVTVVGKTPYDGNVTKTFDINPATLNTNNTVITLKNENFTATGEEIKPEIESVTVDGKTLSPEDYTVEYKDNIGPGTGIVVVKGKGNWTGEAEKEFTIQQAVVETITLNVNNTVIKLTPENASYTGEQIQPAVEVTVNQNTLTKDQDYTVVYGENKNAGSDAGSVTVVGKTPYDGNVTKTFDINPATLDASKTVITLSNENFTATGAEIKPVIVSVVCDGKTLTTDDYTVEYKDNKVPGTGIVVVKGKGNWTGEAQKEFTILPGTGEAIILDLNNTVIKLTPGSATYNGTQIKPATEVVYNSQILTADQDYTVEYGENTNAGSGAGTVTVIGKTPFNGNVTKTFDINPAVLNLNATVITLDNENFTATGVAIEPVVVSVVCDGKTLSTDDYDVEYRHNTEPGTGIVVVKAKRNWTGEAEKEFTIIPGTGETIELNANNTIIKLNPTKPKYTGKAITPKVTVKYNGKTLTENTDYTVSYKNNKNAGTAEAIITGQEAYKGSVTAKFTIAKSKNKIKSFKPNTEKTIKITYNKQKKIKIVLKLLENVKKKKITYKVSTSKKAKKYVKIKKTTGEITVKRGLPKGTYTITVTILVKAGKNCLKTTFKKKIKIKVK